MVHRGIVVFLLVMSLTAIKGQIYDYGQDRRVLHKSTQQYKNPSYVFPWLPIYSQDVLKRFKNGNRKPTPTAKRDTKHSLCFGCCNKPPCWYHHAILCSKCYQRSRPSAIPVH